ncbi:MAG: glycosyltransferase family 25 protein [Thiohalobacteraceae bacterium]
MSIPCWVISLDPTAPTASALGQSLADQDVEYRFIPAVDGRQQPPLLEGKEVLDARKALLRHGRLLRGAELGCYLSHYRALQRAWDEGLERVCLMEDDVGLEADFSRVLAGIEALPDDVEFVRLMALRIRSRKILSLLSGCDRHRLVRPERGWCGTQGYVVNRAGMRKILDTAWRIYEPIDKFYDHFWEYDLRHFGVEPHVIFEHEHASSIRHSKTRALLTPKPLPLPAWLLWLLSPLERLSFSRSRHWYLKAHADEFYPAELPVERMGQTLRMH